MFQILHTISDPSESENFEDFFLYIERKLVVQFWSGYGKSVASGFLRVFCHPHKSHVFAPSGGCRAASHSRNQIT